MAAGAGDGGFSGERRDGSADEASSSAETKTERSTSGPGVERSMTPSRCGSGAGPDWAGNRTGLDGLRSLRAEVEFESDRDGRQRLVTSLR